jgi:hypothetical protein
MRIHAINVSETSLYHALSLIYSLTDREYSKTFPPGFNSFHRLLLYRIAQRFRLSHSLVDENSDRGIILSKNPDISMPKVLLIDLPYDANPGSGNKQSSSMTRETSSDSIDSVDNASNQTASSSQKKVVMMKRNTASENKNLKKDSSSSKQSQAAADKQRQYAEARARIFGLESTADSDDAAKVNASVSSNPPQTSARTIETPAAVYAHPQPVAAATTIITPQEAIETSSSMKAKKALERDRGADQRDPDFVRQTYAANPSPYAPPASYEMPNPMPRQPAYEAQYPPANYYYYDNYPANGHPGYAMPADTAYDPYLAGNGYYPQAGMPMNHRPVEGYYSAPYRGPTDPSYFPPPGPSQGGVTASRYPSSNPVLGPALDPSEFPPLGR